jgi:glutathione synthase/RimK-type ligase-like ATP-grasp enzyme
MVIGEKGDAHFPLVERHLSSPLLVIDTAAMVAGEELSFSFSKDELSVTYRDRPLDNVSGVWLKGRQVALPLSIPVPSGYQGYAKSAVLRHTDALLAHFEKARWVSRPYAMQGASHKPLQLQLAGRLGFKVPETLFTSNPAKAKFFIDNHETVITKTLADDFPINKAKDTALLFYATKIHKGEAIDLSGLSLAPAIFQQAIDTELDLRVTVMGDKIFPAAIVDKKLDPSSPVRDWRIGHHKGELYIEPYKLPKDIADKCIALVKELGLEFGAIDLLVDKKGEIWFLEINSNGRWAFVEHATGQPMGKALADLLQTPR